MRVHVIDVRGSEASVLESAFHGALKPFVLIRLAGEMERITSGAVTRDFAIDLRAARLGVLELLEDYDAGALAHDKAVAGNVERA